MDNSTRNEDQYLPGSEYMGKTPSTAENFVVFDKDGSYFFAMISPTGDVLLRSESYPSVSARDSGIASVQRNREVKERYYIVQDEGGYCVGLKAGNHKEIARSCPYATEEEAWTVYKFVKDGSADYPWVAKMADDSLRAAGSGSGLAEDEYLPCEKYKGYSGGVHGISTFEYEGSYFFAVLDENNEVALRSESYPSISARDNGVQSVLKNRNNKDRYSVKNTDEGWVIILKAGNHKEIARSCPFESEEAAKGSIDIYSLGTVAAVAAAASVTALAADAPAPAVEIAEEPVVESVIEPAVEEAVSPVAAVAEEVIAETETVSEPEAAPEIVVEESKAEESVDATNAAIQAAGLGVAAAALTSTDNTNDSTFQTTSAEPIKEEIKPIEPEVVATPVVEAPKVEEVKATPTAETRAASSYASENNYLACDAYHNRKKSNHPGFTTFHDNRTRKHYFAVVDSDGKVILRSEGYNSDKARDNGIKSVIENRENKDRYEAIQSKSGQHFVILKAANGKEIARSCGNRDKDALMALFPFMLSETGAFPWAAAAAAAGVGGVALASQMADPTRVTEEPLPADGRSVVTPSERFRVEEKVTAAAAAPQAAARVGTPVSAVTTDERRGGFAWLPWLIGALLIGGLLWWLMRGCERDKAPVDTTTAAATIDTTAASSGVAPVAADTVSATATPPPPVDTTTAATPAAAPQEPAPTSQAAPVAAGADCGCDMGRDPVFMRYAYQPVEIKKLGSNPEFGNSHGLTPTQFYNKLNRAYKNRPVSRAFLDRIFRSMGYRNGWKAASPALFSEATVPAGTVGNLGYSANHRTQYSVLNVNEHDQKAFRIKAKNGCDLHFMKTCGNHMFFCTK